MAFDVLRDRQARGRLCYIRRAIREHAHYLAASVRMVVKRRSPDLRDSDPDTTSPRRFFFRPVRDSNIVARESGMAIFVSVVAQK